MITLQDFPLLSFLFFLVLGGTFGSFGTVLLHRLSRGESIGGRSHCPRCRKTLQAWELIPIVSYLLLRGRCRGCGKAIPPWYVLLECLSVLAFLFALFHQGFVFLPSLLLAFSLWLLLLTVLSDAQKGVVSDAFTIPLLFLSAVYAIFSIPFSPLAPILGAGVFAVQWILSRGRWVGSADILIGAAMGFLLLDWKVLLLALAVAYVSGAIAATVLLATGKKTRKDHLPFIPFLAIGTLVGLAWGYDLLAMLMG